MAQNATTRCPGRIGVVGYKPASSVVIICLVVFPNVRIREHGDGDRRRRCRRAKIWGSRGWRCKKSDLGAAVGTATLRYSSALGAVADRVDGRKIGRVQGYLTDVRGKRKAEVLSAATRVSVGNKGNLSTRGDKTEVGNPMERGSADRLIGQKEAADTDRKGVGIIDFNKIIDVWERSRGEPLVNL